MIICDDTIYLAKYARDSNLLDNPVWKQLCCYVNNTKKFNHLLKTDKANQWSNTVKIKFGMKIPFYHKEEMAFDSKNINTNWDYYELLELK